MVDTREEIKRKYRELKQLEDYEMLIETLNNESKNQWWKISTPRLEVSIYPDKAREKFIMFISDEIIRMKSALKI